VIVTTSHNYLCACYYLIANTHNEEVPPESRLTARSVVKVDNNNIFVSKFQYIKPLKNVF
jgi:hypothetical protein